MTSSDVDNTPPQILNVRATTDETGMTTVSWFTDEDTFGEISLDDLDDEESEFGKNHQVYYALCGAIMRVKLLQQIHLAIPQHKPFHSLPKAMERNVLKVEEVARFPPMMKPLCCLQPMFKSLF